MEGLPTERSFVPGCLPFQLTCTLSPLLVRVSALTFSSTLLSRTCVTFPREETDISTQSQAWNRKGSKIAATMRKNSYKEYRHFIAFITLGPAVYPSFHIRAGLVATSIKTDTKLVTFCTRTHLMDSKTHNQRFTT